jgi:hypothetical protein
VRLGSIIFPTVHQNFSTLYHSLKKLHYPEIILLIMASNLSLYSLPTEISVGNWCSYKHNYWIWNSKTNSMKFWNYYIHQCNNVMTHQENITSLHKPQAAKMSHVSGSQLSTICLVSHCTYFTVVHTYRLLLLRNTLKSLFHSICMIYNKILMHNIWLFYRQSLFSSPALCYNDNIQ